MRRPFPIGWRGNRVKRYAVGAYSPRASGGLCRACRRRGLPQQKKFLKEFQKFFPHPQNLIHPFGILVLLSEKGSARS